MKFTFVCGNALLPLLSLMILVTGCSDESSGLKGRAANGSEPDQVLVDTRMVITENGITTGIIESKRVKVFEERNFTSLEDGVIINFFDKKGKQTTTLTADSGEVWGLYENVDSLKAKGDVLIVSEERNASMTGEAIRWQSSSHRVYGDGLVTITTENGFEQGTGFSANDDLTEYEFKGPVKGEIRGEEIELFDRE